MRTFRILIALAIVLGWSGYSPPSAASQLHNFYGIHHEVRHQGAFIRLYRTHLKFDSARLVTLYNHEYGRRLGSAHSFEQLLDFLGSRSFVVERCTGTVFSYGFDNSGRFEASPRGCYSGELVLVHKATGIPVFSLLCGNMFMPPPMIYVPPPESVGASVSYIDKCGFWILYGCRDQQRVEHYRNQTAPDFHRGGGYSGIIPQHD